MLSQAERAAASRRRRPCRPAASGVQTVVLGGVDGITTTFAILAGGVGGALPLRSIAIVALEPPRRRPLHGLLGDAQRERHLDDRRARGAARPRLLRLLCRRGRVPLGVFLVSRTLGAAQWGAMVVAGAVAVLSSPSSAGSVAARGRSPPAGAGRLRSVARVVGLGTLASALAFVVGRLVQGLPEESHAE